MTLSENQRERMLNESIPKLVNSLAVPTLIIQIITLVYNTADTYFVSQINKSASAAVGAMYAVMALIQAVGYGFGMGAATLISIKLGEKEDEKANVISSSAFYGAFAVALLLSTAGLIFFDELMDLLGCSNTLFPYAKPYARCILIAAPMTCSSFVLNNILRAEGQSKISMYGMVTGGILNVVLDPLFIFTFKMGTFGAALATVISQLVSFIILIIQFIRGKSILHLKIKNISKDIKIYGLIVATGVPTFFRQGLSSIATAALSRQAVVYGDAVLAAITIANKCYFFLRNIVLGVGQGFQPVAGYNYGAKIYKRTKDAFYYVTKVGTVVCTLSAVLIAVFAKQIILWFCPDSQVLEYGVKTIYFACAVMPFMAFQPMSISFSNASAINSKQLYWRLAGRGYAFCRQCSSCRCLSA